jgi:pimeloyl-ACP methyl ester carboxylesterase
MMEKLELGDTVAFRTLALLVTATIAVMNALSPATGAAQVRETTRAALASHSIAMGSYHLHTVTGGVGRPIVVFESGMGDGTGSWDTIQPAIAKLTTTLAYDRSGLGQSEPAPQVHDINQSAHELHSLLEKSGLPAPYILVAHSMGGLIIRAFANRYPHEVAGMVLVDPHEERIDDRLHAMLSPADFQQYAAALQRHIQSPAMRADREGMTSGAEVANEHLPDVPKILLARIVITDDEVGIARAFREAGLALHREWVRKTPHAELVEVPTADHYIQDAAPDAVIAAIRKVLRESAHR